MLQPTVKMLSAQENQPETADAVLLLMAGTNYVGYCVLDKKTVTVHEWVIYSAGEENSINWTETIAQMVQMHPVLGQSFTKTFVIIDRPEAVLMPGSLSRDEIRDALAELMFGKSAQDVYIKDLVQSGNMVNHYAVPTELGMVLNARFPKSEWWHINSLWLNHGEKVENGITVAFLFQQMHIQVYSNGELLLIQQYAYHTPEEALYRILHTMDQLALNREETPVQVDGMIVKTSALGEKLHQYIPRLSWNEKVHYSFPAEAEQYPSTLMAYQDRLAACVL